MRRIAVAALISMLVFCGAQIWPLHMQVASGAVKAAASDEVWVAQKSPVTSTLSTVAAPNSTTACAVGNGGNVIFTGDEGETWAKQKQMTGVDLHDVCSTDSSNFWYVGEGGTIVYTYDGAKTWKFGSCNMSNPLYGISMATKRVGWTCGASTVGHLYSSMWNTFDGVNFTDQDWWNIRDVFSVSAWDIKHAIAVGSSDLYINPVTFTTVDNSSWSNGLQFSPQLLYAVCTVPGTKKAFAVGNKGTAYVCDNYGLGVQDWTKLNTGVTQNLWDVEVVDGSTVWAVGDDGVIIKTEDGGATWVKQSSPTTADLHGVSAVDAHHAWAVGEGGTILYARPQPKIVGCVPSSVPQGYNDNLNVTGSNTHFKDGTSRAVVTPSDGVSVISTSIPGGSGTEANVHIQVADSAKPGTRNVTIVTGDENPTPGVFTVTEKPLKPPYIDSIYPPQSPVSTYVTLNGHDFGDVQGTSTVIFNSGAVATDYTLWSNGKITCRIPTSAVSGNVVVKTTGGTSNGVYFEVTEPQNPQIIDTDPNSVKQGDTVEITIEGKFTHFGNGSAATFTPSTGITVIYTTVVDSNTVKAGISVSRTAPTDYSDVNVITGSETPKAMAKGLKVQPYGSTPPVLKSIFPTSGSVGDEVTLTGSDFGASRGGSYVSFTGANATTYTVWNKNTIKCLVPGGAKTGVVTVTTPQGTSGGELFTVGSPLIKDCDPQGAVQGQYVEVDVLGKYTHFVNGESKMTFSGKGVSVTATGATDPNHATGHVRVSRSASPGYSDVNVITGTETPQPLVNVFNIYKAPSGPPYLHDVTPGVGRVGTVVTLTGKNFGAVRGSSQVVFNRTVAGHYISWSDHSIICSVPFGATTGTVQVRTAWGNSGGILFEVPISGFYFAEGSCRPNFNSYLTIQNPGAKDAGVEVNYMLGNGGTKQQSVIVPKHARRTLTPSDVLGVKDDSAHDFSVDMVCTNEQSIVAERPMYFDYGSGWTDGHDAMGLLNPAKKFYFAEGSSRPGYNPYICVANPGGAQANVTITYMLGNAKTRKQFVTVPPHSRKTVSAFNFLGSANDAAHDFSAEVECTNGQKVVAERPMYFNYQGKWNGGHDAMGLVTPATSFYLAEGACRTNFQPYITVQNPGRIYTDVRITLYTGTGEEIERVINMAPESRSTLTVSDVLGSGDEPFFDFSAKVKSLNGQEIIAERPMYFNYQGNWNGGHDIVGALAPASAFYFAEGTCRPNFAPYLTIMNPELAHANVKITYMLGNGSTKEQVILVPARTRATVPVFNLLGTANDTAHDFSARVACTNNQDIVVERPMYFNYQGKWDGGSIVMGFHAD